MTSPRRLTLALLACLVLLLGACGSDGDAASDVDTESDATADDSAPTDDSDSAGTEDVGDGAGADGDSGSDSAGAEEDEGKDAGAESSDDDDAAGDGGEGPCAAGAVLGEAFPGAEFGDPIQSTGERGVQEVEWTTVGCRWESPTHEVRAQTAGPDDFEGGFVCAEPLDGPSAGMTETVVVDDLGDQAWWTWDDFQSGIGELAVCAGELRIDITVKGPRDGDPIDEASTLEGSKTLAEALL